jgi:hypothetical protein
MNTNNASPKDDSVLQDIVAKLHQTDDALEYHLPKIITELDKPALLAVIYRLVSKAE